MQRLIKTRWSPAAEFRTAGLPAFGLADQADKGFLRHALGVAVIAQHVPGVRHERRQVAMHQQGPRGLIAVGHAGDQGIVAGGRLGCTPDICPGGRARSTTPTVSASATAATAKATSGRDLIGFKLSILVRIVARKPPFRRPLDFRH